MKRLMLLAALPLLFGCSTICGLLPTLPGCPEPTPVPACLQPCAGDCNGDCVVADDEVDLCGEMFLKHIPTDSCKACDPNADGTVTAEELQAALDNSAVAGGSCPK